MRTEPVDDSCNGRLTRHSKLPSCLLGIIEVALEVRLSIVGLLLYSEAIDESNYLFSRVSAVRLIVQPVSECARLLTKDRN
jgi:hypothetical protein